MAVADVKRKRSQCVWAPDPLEGYVLGHVTDVGGNSLTVELVDTSKQSIIAAYEDVYPAVDELFDKPVEDNCSLVYLNEATLLHNIHQRYRKDMIYSYVANILLAVNPYKEIPGLYTLENAKKYKGKSLGVLPPHVFAIADKVYRDLRTNRLSQSVVVSGESGAGKTETTKFILRYLTQIYGAAAGIIEQRIVEANPLLESFGNSTTTQNINSSRFGKFVEVHFDAEFKVVGGHISHYLLEKSRVCSQVNKERNYHVFYYMLSAGAPKEMKQALGLDPNAQYNYLSNKSTERETDDEGYHKLVQSMDSIGMSNEEKIEVFRITAAVLHLGNIQFEEESYGQKGGSTVSESSSGTVHIVSGLLGIGKDDLCRSLTSRVMTTTKKGTVGTVINVPLKPDQAANARDALAKAIYVRLFDWIIERVNKCFPFTSSRYYIGVLDIAGFEYYQFNSFEQFCINYCNEKLQQLFNERVLKEEQELYKREGLGLPTVRYVDNQDCIDLIECNGNGIIDLLDEECKIPRGSNEQFTASVHKKFTGHFRIQLPRQSRLSQHKSLRDEEGFIIRHFAGAVCYKTTGFLEKNNDALHSSLEQLLMTSSDTLIQCLFTQPKSTSSTTLAKKLVLESVSSKFRTQLNQLMQRLRQTDASFIRCLKPNQNMIPGKFMGGQVLSQLQCAGMVAVLKLMEGGYPSRTQFIDLYNMYKKVLPDDLVKLDPRMFCEALFRAIGIRDREFKFGHNKVFFRAGKFAEFDEVMQTDPEKLSVMVLKVKQWLVSKQWRKVIYGAISVQKLSRKIRYRQESAIKIQSAVRMILAVKKYSHRYKGARDLRLLQERIEELKTLASKLKSNQEVMIQRSRVLTSAVDKQMQELKTISLSSDEVDTEYNKIVNSVEKYMIELQSRQEQEKVEEEERELMRQLKEKQEQEKRQKEEELARLKAQKEEEERQKEENRKKKELETQKYLKEKQEQEERDRILAQQLQQTMDSQAMAAIEQERRDFELALRLSQNDAQSQAIITEQSKWNQRQQQQNKLPPKTTMTLKQVEASIKSYDLTKWKYAQLRDTINTSCDIKLLEECKEELHRRLRAYHSWRDANTGQSSEENERIPQQALAQTMTSSVPKPLPSQQQHRYFKVPFLRPSDDNEKAEKTRGWWYAHFDGSWIARQLELHPNQPPLLLYAGYDDMEMCELRLEETGLTRKKGAEISKEHFEEAWKKCGGKPYNPPSTKL